MRIKWHTNLIKKFKKIFKINKDKTKINQDSNQNLILFKQNNK